MPKQRLNSRKWFDSVVWAKHEVPDSLYFTSKKFGTPERIRTSDLLLRRQTLYPAELRAHEEHLRRLLRQAYSSIARARTRGGSALSQQLFHVLANNVFLHQLIPILAFSLRSLIANLASAIDQH